MAPRVLRRASTEAGELDVESALAPLLAFTHEDQCYHFVELDGDRLVSGGNEPRIYVSDLAAGIPVKTLEVSALDICDVSFVPGSGNLVATGTFFYRWRNRGRGSGRLNPSGFLMALRKMSDYAAFT